MNGLRHVVRSAYETGANDMLRAVREQLERGPEIAVSWAERMWRDPETFEEWLWAAREERES